MLFDLYWRLLGLPLSRLKGAVTDAVPFSLVEAALWVGATACLVLALSFARPGFFSRDLRRRRALRLGALLLGPVFLIALGLGQGAFPLSIAPTALRGPLADRLGNSIDSTAFLQWVRVRESSLRAYLVDAPRAQGHWKDLQALREEEVLRACDTSLDTVLSLLELTPGRTVRAVKDMGPWTTTLGLLYGGPAFHDPFFGELAIIPERAYPVSHYWRLLAACHETAHAKGFTREMDAEILTQLALVRVEDPRYRALADIHFLRKTGTRITWPDSLLAEARRTGAARDSLLKERRVLSRVKGWMRRANVQNSPVKYGQRGAAEAWNPDHPFFSSIHDAFTAKKEKDAHAP
jgi:hypothetical protein